MIFIAIPLSYRTKVRWCNLCRECRDELLKKHIAVITWLHVVCFVRNQPRNWVLLQFILEIPNYHYYTEKSSHLWRMMVMVHLWTSMVVLLYTLQQYHIWRNCAYNCGGAIYYVDDWLHWLCRLEHVFLWNSLHWLTETKLLWCTHLWWLHAFIIIRSCNILVRVTKEQQVYRMSHFKTKIVNSIVKHLYSKKNISNDKNNCLQPANCNPLIELCEHCNESTSTSKCKENLLLLIFSSCF